MTLLAIILGTTFALLVAASICRAIGARRAASFLATVRHSAALAMARYEAKQADLKAAAVAGLAAHDRHMAIARALQAAPQLVVEAKARERQARAETAYAFAAALHAQYAPLETWAWRAAREADLQEQWEIAQAAQA